MTEVLAARKEYENCPWIVKLIQIEEEAGLIEKEGVKNVQTSD